MGDGADDAERVAFLSLRESQTDAADEKLKSIIRTAVDEATGFSDHGDGLIQDQSDMDQIVDSVFECIIKQYSLTDKFEKPPVSWPNQAAVAYFDGNGDKKSGLAQFRIYWGHGKIEPSSTQYTGKTNNELEYLGLINLLKFLLGVAKTAPEYVIREWVVTIHGDSKVVINQTLEKWRVREDHLIPYRDEALQLLSELKTMVKWAELSWVPSKENKVDAHA